MDSPTAVSIEELLRHRNWVRCLARELVIDDSAVDDIEQETWLAAIKRPPRQAGLMTWFRVVVRNIASKERRADSRRGARQATIASATDGPPAAADVVVEAELHEDLVRAVRQLGEPYRTTLLLRYFEGLPPRVVARRMEVPVATVRVRIQRGLERLRERLDKQHGSRESWHRALLPLTTIDVAASGLGMTTSGALLMSMPTKILAAAAALLILAAVVWSTWTSPAGDAGDAAPSSVAHAAVEQRPALATHSGEAPVADNDRVSVSTPPAPSLPPPRGAWVRVTRSDSHGGPPLKMLARFVDTTGVDHNAAGEHGLLKVPEAVSGAAVLWLTTPGALGLHRFASRVYPEGTTELRIRGAAGLLLHFVTNDGTHLNRQEIERRYAAAGVAMSAKWLGEGRLEQADGMQAMLTPPPDDHWLCAATFSWRDDSVLEVTNAPAEGRWRLLFNRALAPIVLLNVPTPEQDRVREINVLVPRSPLLQLVRFEDADTGAPLVGARVTPYYEHGDDEAFFAGTVRHTDSSGQLMVPAPMPRESSGRSRPPHWFVETSSHLGVIRPSELLPADATNAYVKSVGRKASLHGRAFTPAGQPAAGALVITMEKGYARRAKVDDHGRYELHDLLPERNTGVLLVTDFARSEVQMGHANLTSGATVKLDIGKFLDPGAVATLRGRISAGQSPVVGAMVFVKVVGQNGGKRLFTKTDSQGNYVLRGIAPGSVEHRILLGDFAVSDDFGLEWGQRLRLRAGESVVRDFALPEGAIQVQVLDADGEPLAGISVYVRPEERGLEGDRFPGYRFQMGWCGKTDDRGELELLGISPGMPMRVYGHQPKSRWEFTRRSVTAGSLTTPTQLVIQQQ